SNSGPTGQSNDVPTTASRWAAYVNAHGGISGHPVKVYVEDDKSNPALTVSDYQDLVSNKHAVAIGDATFNDKAFEQQADAAKIPVISIDQGGATFTYASDANFFSNSTTVPADVWANPYVGKL